MLLDTKRRILFTASTERLRRIKEPQGCGINDAARTEGHQAQCPRNRWRPHQLIVTRPACSAPAPCADARAGCAAWPRVASTPLPLASLRAGASDSILIRATSSALGGSLVASVAMRSAMYLRAAIEADQLGPARPYRHTGAATICSTCSIQNMQNQI